MNNENTMTVSLSGGNTGARQWQDCILFSEDGSIKRAKNSGESTLSHTKHTGNAAYSGIENFEIEAKTIIFAKDCGEYYRCELLKGELPEEFPTKSYRKMGDVAKKFNLVCRAGILRTDPFY